MEYKGYHVHEEKNKMIIEGVEDFHPVHILECGQCFRWSKENDGSYTGIVKGKVVNIRYNSCKLEILNASTEDLTDLWFDYFDLGRDYGEIKNSLSKDKIMRKAISYGSGMRLLKQDPWETLISFILSSNSNIPKIIKTITVISREFGEEIRFNDKSYYTFPDIEKLARSSAEELNVCRGGYRCKYIFETSNMIRQGLVNLNSLKVVSSSDARNELIKLSGVGNKVADCILLYSGLKLDVFPTDVWIKRVIEELYFKREATLKEIQDFAQNSFGDLAGFAQQYLFYYARENKIGRKH